MRKTGPALTPVSRTSDELNHKSVSDAMSALFVRDDGTSMFLGKSFLIVNHTGVSTDVRKQELRPASPLFQRVDSSG